MNQLLSYHSEGNSQKHLQAMVLSIVLSLVLPLVQSYAASFGQLGRTFRIDDLFKLQQFGRDNSAFAFSPDGKKLAFVVQRPHPSRRPKFWLFGNERSDVYVLSTDKSAPVNVTQGEADNTGFWSPSWSPDSKWLAMLSTKSGALSLCVWKPDGSPKRITERDVDLSSTMDHPYIWISATRLLVPLVPPGTTADVFKGEGQGADERTRAFWARTWQGDQVSASKLSTGVKPDLTKRPQGELVAVDVETGETQVVTRGTTRGFTVSPNQKAVAYVRRTEIYQPEPDQPLSFDGLPFKDKFSLEVVSSSGMQLLSQTPASNDVVPASLRWSPDSNELVFLSYINGRNAVSELVRFDVSRRRIDLPRIGGTEGFSADSQSPQIEWTGRGWMLLATRRNQNGGKQTRRDWWLVTADGSLRCLTEAMSTPPSKLWRESGRDSYVGEADGKLWRISADAPPLNLVPALERISIIWPWRGSIDAQTAESAYRQVLVSAHMGERDELYNIDLASGHTIQMLVPLPEAKIAGFSPSSMATLYSLSNRTGLRLWLALGSNAKSTLIFEANTFLQEISAGAYRRIEYRSFNGEILIGWVILPPAFQNGTKYPLIVWPYPGSRPNDSPGPLADISYDYWLNLQIVAARGYAVLLPSAPLKPEGELDDVLLKLTAGVLPAVDKVIDLGIADPNRVFLMGHSFGGLATYGLITQTNRFKAAVAIAGYTDLVSAYGQFFFGRRYQDYPIEAHRWGQAGIEDLLRHGSPPWKDLGRYLRNSPIFYVDRVQTPLLIIHGDLDAAPIEQAEEFFTALDRQGKRAEFVRYWGEGHNLESPANIRDAWERIFAWFDEFSQQQKDTSASRAHK
jgi:dipeptidyl aminopeptidase/acylaminoacyl peptidase